MTDKPRVEPLAAAPRVAAPSPSPDAETWRGIGESGRSHFRERIDNFVTFGPDAGNGAGLNAVFVGKMPVHHFRKDLREPTVYLEKLRNEVAAFVMSEKAPAVPPEPTPVGARDGWIPVSERLPRYGTSVLFYNAAEKWIESGVLIDAGDERDDFWECDRSAPQDEPIRFRVRDELVTHWMPLPAPPNADSPIANPGKMMPANPEVLPPQLGIGYLINRLSGNEATFAAYQKAQGKTIESLTLDKSQGDGAFLVRFTDGSGIRIQDGGRSCCESRYMVCDDELDQFKGATFNEIGLEAFEPPKGEYDEAHEALFVRIQTSKGAVTLETHNEHNGYYGGIDIVIDEI